jgi:hypothetical protein
MRELGFLLVMLTGCSSAGANYDPCLQPFLGKWTVTDSRAHVTRNAAFVGACTKLPAFEVSSVTVDVKDEQTIVWTETGYWAGDDGQTAMVYSGSARRYDSADCYFVVNGTALLTGGGTIAMKRQISLSAGDLSGISTMGLTGSPATPDCGADFVTTGTR